MISRRRLKIKKVSFLSVHYASYYSQDIIKKIFYIATQC